MPIAEIATILTSLSTAIDIVKSILAVSKDTSLNEKVIALQNAILSLQSGMLALQSEHSQLIATNKALEEELAKLKGWEETKKNYELREIASGVFVYALKPDAGTGEASHYTCTQCFQQGHKSILQLTKQVIAGHYYMCPNCKTEICDHSKRQNIRF